MTPEKCPHCGNRYHWSHAFSKFGYDDGDGLVETPAIAELLEAEGYRVQYDQWLLHNTIIYSIQKDGRELMPLDDTNLRIGYDDPRLYLPDSLQAVLNSKIPFMDIFPY